MMQWRKLGVVFSPPGNVPWMASHATTPTPLDLGDGKLRIYFSARDVQNVSRVGFVDVDASNPRHILRVSAKPCLDVGIAGGFDDSGALCTRVLRLNDGRLLMYYVGFELCTRVRYRLLTGAAISEDGGETFIRAKPTAILERSASELYFRCAAFVLNENDIFRMWYVAGNSWLTLSDKPVPVYELRYMESDNGIDWPAEGTTVMRFGEDEHGLGRPWVIHENGRYKLHYSIRKISQEGYRLGYAESDDGKNWLRMDDQLGLTTSIGDWDSEEIMYSAVIDAHGKTYAFYNGNNFGEHGFGVAVLDQT
ncbi:MAG TPA: hypothetical protein VFW00_10230 [Rhodocyclaceae bacterium]|nr:hypothetical protein [Rhodocyclaceae bacterium]